jgi:transposase
MSQTAPHTVIAAEILVTVLAVLRCHTTPHRDFVRHKIVLMSHNGMSDGRIAQDLHIHVNTVRKWRRRFRMFGLDGLKDDPRSGRPRTYDYKKVKADILGTLKKDRTDGSSHWINKTVAEDLGVSEDIVGRIMRANNIKLYRFRSWCPSKDPRFQEKMANIVKLYTEPPPNSLVICVDEKTSMQAIERASGFVDDGRGGAVRGQASTYTRHGVLNLIAGLDIKNGIVYGKMYGRKRRIEFLDFMDFLVESIPGANDPDSGLQIHIVLDNYCIHYGCDEWLEAHPNVTFHYTPTSASWLNMVEIFFGKLTRTVLKRGNFKSTEDMADAIRAYIKVHNELHKEYKWKKLEVRGAQLSDSHKNFCD